MRISEGKYRSWINNISTWPSLPYVGWAAQWYFHAACVHYLSLGYENISHHEDPLQKNIDIAIARSAKEYLYIADAHSANIAIRAMRHVSQVYWIC